MQMIRTVFDWIFPPSDEALCVRSLSVREVSLLYSPRIIEGVYALSKFSDFNIRALIHEAKFHDSKQAQNLLAVLVERFLKERSGEFDLIIPVPLSKKRLRERGHNQVASILMAGKCDDAYIASDMLMRVRHTKPQTELAKKARLQNVRDAFLVTHPNGVEGRRVLLVDDVMTTGATLHAAKLALLQHSPAAVTCLALAH